jgi:hypothetical protein
VTSATPVPTPLRVLGWVGVALGVLGVCSMPFTLFGLLVEQPATAALTRDPAYRIVAWGQLLFSVPLIALQIIGCVGALRARSWSRPVLHTWVAGAFLQLCAGVGAFGFAVLPVMGPMLDASDPVSRIAAASGIGAAGCGLAFGALLPVAVLVVLGLSSVRAAYAAWSSGA